MVDEKEKKETQGEKDETDEKDSEETTDDDSNNGENSEKLETEKQVGRSPMIEEAKKQADRLEAIDEKLGIKIKKLESLQTEEALGGKSHGGGAAKETEDEKWNREAKERYAGTGMDPTPHDGTPTVYS